MTANAIFGVIGTMIGGAACFCLGYHCALRWIAAELESMNREEWDMHPADVDELAETEGNDNE
jgi:hypothetical protein